MATPKTLKKLKAGNRVVLFKGGEFIRAKVASADMDGGGDPEAPGEAILDCGEFITVPRESMSDGYVAFCDGTPESFVYFGYDFAFLAESLMDAARGWLADGGGPSKCARKHSRLNEKAAKLIWKWIPKLRGQAPAEAE